MLVKGALPGWRWEQPQRVLCLVLRRVLPGDSSTKVNYTVIYYLVIIQLELCCLSEFEHLNEDPRVWRVWHSTLTLKRYIVPFIVPLPPPLGWAVRA